MTRALAVDEAKHGVRVNWSVDPSFSHLVWYNYLLDYVKSFQLCNEAVKRLLSS